jgi:peptidylprolyl isomerase
VATSRRRERELARRRFERRRQAELERRAKAKRRNTIIGATAGTAAVIVGVVVLVIALSGGSDKAKVKAGATPTPTASPPPAAPKKCVPINPNPPRKGEPFVPQVKGKNPSSLVTKDIKKGHGAVAKKTSKVRVRYIGFSCATGKQFDPPPPGKAGTTINAALGTGNVIPGWDQGIPGMRVGGERELVIPAALAYQSNPGATGVPNDTLIFVIDLLKA